MKRFLHTLLLIAGTASAGALVAIWVTLAVWCIASAWPAIWTAALHILGAAACLLYALFAFLLGGRVYISHQKLSRVSSSGGPPG